MKAIYLGAYSVPDGCFGDRTTAHVVLVQEGEACCVCHVFPFGWLRSPFLPMDIANESEARWLIKNSYNGKKYYL